MENYWKKFYECDCNGEGIMISYETSENGLPYVYLAYWSEGVHLNKKMSFKQRLRWCWKILKTGEIWNDMVMLTPETANKLGCDLLTFARKKYNIKERKK